MTGWFYLAFGFALFFALIGGEEGFKSRRWKRAFQLTLGLALVAIIDLLMTPLLWRPSGREDLRLISLFLWVFLINQWMLWGKPAEKTRIPVLPNPAFIALLGFCLWTIGGEGGNRLDKRFFAGLGMPFASATLEWFLVGLRERVKLSSLPPALEGEPILFWLAMLLFFGF